MKSIPYSYVSTPAKKTPFEQMRHLQLTFAAATTAETHLETVRTIAHQEYTSNHALYSNVTNHSTAEKTISRYIKPKCWGCQEEGHSYAKKDDKGRDIVTCPNKDNKGVAEMAEKGRAAFNAYMKKKRSKGSSNGGGKRKVNALIAKYTEGMDDDEVEAFLSSKSHSKAAKKDSSKGDSQCFTLM
eukprot:scaffold112134_cov46-Attheya_sp.AAC.1